MGRFCRSRFLAGVVLCVGLLLLSACAETQDRETESSTNVPAGSIQGMLDDGSNFRVVMPEAWNGTLVLDLYFANNLEAPPSVIEQWMTANGFAIGGISVNRWRTASRRPWTICWTYVRASSSSGAPFQLVR